MVFLGACSSTHSLQSAFTYDELNAMLKGEQATIVLKDGKEMYAQKVWIARDSVAWLDPRSGEESTLSVGQLKQIVMVRKSHFLGGLEGLALGAMGGIGIGWLITSRRDYDDGLLLLNMIVQGGIWGGVGLIAGAIVGHRTNYELDNIRIRGLSVKADLLYLKDGSIVRGTIIAEVSEGESLVRITIRDVSGEARTYDASEIERIEEEH